MFTEEVDTIQVDPMRPPEVAGQKVSVIGAARSGVAVARLLQERGALVFVSDSGDPVKLHDQAMILRSKGIDFEVGAHTDRALDSDLVVLSPGVPSDNPIVKEALVLGLRVVGELEVACWFCPASIIAVTGTNGKTTTTTLIGRMLYDDKKKHVVGGNIGNAFSSILDELDSESIAVLEVSSFQLDHVERFRPAVSVLLNITPDHLDRYDHDFNRYIDAKCKVFANQMPGDTLIYNYDDPVTREAVKRSAPPGVQLLSTGIERKFEEGAFIERGKLITVLGGRRAEVISTREISIRGIHNLQNAMAATLAAQVMGVGIPSIRATLRNFKGVEHRLEFVREVRGIRFVNDSKATNVESVWYALQSFEEPIILLLGGRDKGNDYTRLYELVRQRVKGIVAIGESSSTIVSAFRTLVPVVEASSMESAVNKAMEMGVPGDVVLLSPACSSFDWFQNFEHRGRTFKHAVGAL